MNINLKTVTEWTNKLMEVKGKYIEMQRRCQGLTELRKEVQEKEEKINQKKHSFLFDKTS